MSDELDFLIADARRGAQRMRARSLAAPCFDDVVERARAMDASAVPPPTEHPEDVVALHASERGSTAEEAALDEVIEGARAAVGRRVAQRRLDGVPAPRLPARPAPKRRALVVGAVAVAMAAGIVGAFAMQSTALLERDEVDTRGEQAVRATPGDRSEGQAENAPPPPSPARRAPPAEHVEVDPEETEPAPEPETVEELEPRRPKLTAAERAAKRRARLGELAQSAQQHWRDGDLAEARRLFKQVVAEGGRSREAEMAYADLFALARQRGKGQAKLWRAYLERFPRGRFADDARAGRCRVASDERRVACWRRYLDAFPEGSYRAEAERAAKR